MQLTRRKIKMQSMLRPVAPVSSEVPMNRQANQSPQEISTVDFLRSCSGCGRVAKRLNSSGDSRSVWLLVLYSGFSYPSVKCVARRSVPHPRQAM